MEDYLDTKMMALLSKTCNMLQELAIDPDMKVSLNQGQAPLQSPATSS